MASVRQSGLTDFALQLLVTITHGSVSKCLFSIWPKGPTTHNSALGDVTQSPACLADPGDGEVAFPQHGLDPTHPPMRETIWPVRNGHTNPTRFSIQLPKPALPDHQDMPGQMILKPSFLQRKPQVKPPAPPSKGPKRQIIK